MSSDSLWLALEATFSADRPTRQAAEEFLTGGGDCGCNTRGDWCALLLDFAVTPVTEGGAPSGAQGLASDLDVRVACAVFLKNSVSEKEWLGGESFSPECKSGIRDRLIGALCDVALADRVRKVLSSLLEHLHAYDWLRGEWPGLLPATLSALHSSLQGFDQFAPDFIASVAANASSDFGNAPEAPADGQLSSTIKVIATCALLLKLCCKVYDDPVKILIKDQDDHAATVVGPLGEVLTRLTNADWLRAVRDAKRTTATLDGTRMMPKDHSTWVHVVAASDEASYMALKSAWYIAGNRIPVAFADETFFTAFQQAAIELWRHCNDSVYDFRAGMLLSRRGEPLDADEVVVSTERPKSTYFWKLYKRVVSLSHRFLQSTITAKLVEVRLKPLAKAFVEQIAPSMLELALATIALHNNKSTVVDVIGSSAFNEAYPPVGISSNSLASPEQPFTSKALIMSLEFVEVATGNQAMYGTIHEYAAPLLTEVLFDRLSITAAERELWAVNPVDFVRRLTDPRDDLWNPKICSASLMRQLCVPPKSFQDKTLIAGFAQHIQSVLVSAPQEITDATDFEEGSSAWFAALKLDACLYAMSQLRDAVSNAWPIAQVMLNFVAPLLNSSVGFLRARAVHVLASFLPKIEWPSAEDYHSVLERLLPLLRDPEVPVRIRTALGCSGFIRHPLAHDAVAPRVGAIIKDLLDVVKEMDSDSVVHAMRKIIKHYAATVAEWAVPLATALVEHFTSLHATIAERIAAQEENSVGAITKQSDAEGGDGLDQDDVQDAIAAADELLATLATLTKSIPHAPEAAALFYQLQEIIAPVLSVLLSGAQNMGFMDIALRLLTRLVQRSDAVLPVTWDTFRSLHRVVCEGNAVDYFGHLVSPIDNFVSVDPTTFVAASVEATEAAASPAALLLEMCQCVLKQTAMLRRREVLPVFAITDIVFINAQHAKVDPEVAAAFARRYASSFAALPAQYYSDLQQRGRSAPQPAEWAIMTTGYLGVLLYTAKAVAAPQELFSIFPPQQLFYVLSSMGELAPTAVNLRVYDRKVFIAAVLAILSSAASAPDDAGVDVSSAAGALHTAFVMLLQNAAVESCAVRAAVKKAAKFNAAGGNKQQHRDPYAMDDFTSDDEDDDSDESSADGDDGDDDDDDLDGMDAHDQFEDDLGDEGSDVDEDDKAIRNYDHFATTVAAARKLAAKEAGLLDGEEDEEDEEELAEDHLDETDFSSPIDAYDEYASFGELLQGINSSAWVAEVVNHALADYSTVANVLPSEMAPEAAVKALTKNGPPTLVHAADCNEGAAFGGDVVGPDVTVSLSDLLVAASQQRRFLTEHHISAKR